MAPPTIVPPRPAERLCGDGSWERAEPLIDGRGSGSSGSGVDSVNMGEWDFCRAENTPDCSRQLEKFVQKGFSYMV